MSSRGLFLLISWLAASVLSAQQAVKFPETSPTVPRDSLAIQIERQSGDIRVLSTRIEGLEKSFSASFQRMESDLAKNREKHETFQHDIDELRADYRIYPWLFTGLGALLFFVGQYFISKWLKSRFPDGRPPLTTAIP